MNRLFTPLQLGHFVLPNRVIMAPMTRTRAGAGRVPTPLMAKYYAQRASAGLIISEATSIGPMAVGYPDTPGIWSAEQVAGWQGVTRAVHAAGGRIFCQLWHVGRISDPVFLDGQQPLAPSPIAAEGHVRLLRPQRDYVTPRALATDEIPAVVEEFRQAALNAKAAGFDGVEIHAANGYLLDQFLQDSTNHRDDRYGGPIENRARLLLEVVEAVASVWGPQCVGVHLSPRGDENSMGDSDPLTTFVHVASELGRRNIAFLFVRESLGSNRAGPALKDAFGGVYIANEGFTHESAEAAIAAGSADAVAFGKDFIANPDLPSRLADALPLAAPGFETVHGYGLSDLRAGYVDYPAAETAVA